MDGGSEAGRQVSLCEQTREGPEGTGSGGGWGNGFQKESGGKNRKMR